MKHFTWLRISLFAFFMLTISLTTFSQSSKGSLQDLKIIEGRWIGTFNGGPIEAAWTAPMGDNIVGYIRMIRDNKPALYEIFAFEETENGPVARVKHFKPGLISVEEKEVADTYNFVEASKNQVLFEKTDKQVRIIYELRKKNQFIIQKGTPKDGGWEFIDLFVFDRIK